MFVSEESTNEVLFERERQPYAHNYAADVVVPEEKLYRLNPDMWLPTTHNEYRLKMVERLEEKLHPEKGEQFVPAKINIVAIVLLSILFLPAAGLYALGVLLYNKFMENQHNTKMDEIRENIRELRGAIPNNAGSFEGEGSRRDSSSSYSEIFEAMPAGDARERELLLDHEDDAEEGDEHDRFSGDARRVPPPRVTVVHEGSSVEFDEFKM